MRKMVFWLVLSVTILSATSVAAELTTDQFAYGLPLVVSGDQTFYELELPVAVYKGSLRSDLGDLRVFNASGQVVPHLLRHPLNQIRRQEVASTELPFFPLAADDVARPGDDLSVHVERTADGTVVDVHSDSRDARTRNYLVDACGLQRRIETLELLWAADTAAFLTEVVIETSDDLVLWQKLSTVAVARLSYQNFRFDQNTIELPRANRRYLRLLWPAGEPQVTLTRIRVLTRQNDVVQRPVARRLTFALQQVSAGRYRVDLQGALPVASVSVLLPDKNSLAALRLSSSNRDQGPMNERWHGLAYNLSTNGSRLTNPAITVMPTRQRFWELTLDSTETTLSSAPQLEFSWQPERLIFLAQGEGPYVVAYGSSTVGPKDYQMDALLKAATPTGDPSLLPQLVQYGEPFSLGGDDAISSRQPFPWKKYGLWGVLLAGVLLIGGMSWSLYRTMQKGS